MVVVVVGGGAHGIVDHMMVVDEMGIGIDSHVGHQRIAHVGSLGSPHRAVGIGNGRLGCIFRNPVGEVLVVGIVAIVGDEELLAPFPTHLIGHVAAETAQVNMGFYQGKQGEAGSQPILLKHEWLGNACLGRQLGACTHIDAAVGYRVALDLDAKPSASPCSASQTGEEAHVFLAHGFFVERHECCVETNIEIEDGTKVEIEGHQFGDFLHCADFAVGWRCPKPAETTLKIA